MALDQDKVIFNCGGRIITLESFSLTMNYDALSDGCAIVFPWEPGKDPELDSVTKAFSYKNTTVYIGTDLMLTGNVYTVKQSRSEDGRRFKTITAYSSTVDLIDCNVNAPHNFFNQTLEFIVSNQGRSYRLNTIVDPNAAANASKVIPVARSNLTDNMFEWLSKLAKQYGLMLSSHPTGAIMIRRYGPIPGESPPETIIESAEFTPGSPDAVSFECEFDGRKRFSHYAAIVSSRNEYLRSVVVDDNNVPRERTKRFEVNETPELSLQEAVMWEASKNLADALTIPFPVVGWRGSSGKLWKPGTIVLATSETMSLKNAKMLIKSVEFKLDATGKRAVLSLVPPEVYSGEPIVDPFI